MQIFINLDSGIPTACERRSWRDRDNLYLDVRNDKNEVAQEKPAVFLNPASLVLRKVKLFGWQKAF